MTVTWPPRNPTWGEMLTMQESQFLPGPLAMHALTKLMASYSDGQITEEDLHALKIEEMHDLIADFKKHWNERVDAEAARTNCDCDACKAERAARASDPDHQDKPGDSPIPDAFKNVRWDG